jgi:predicted regulator of Ras-like GTPase activity (Roadblock/LC7/MglB family)
MKAHAAESWVQSPLQRFVDDARVSFAVLLQPNGQVLGQFGFTRAVDVMAACALVAAIHVSAAQLGRELDGKPFRELYHSGRTRQIFIAEAATARGPVVLLAAFDSESSLGLVQLYFRELCAGLAQAAPTPAITAPAAAASEPDFLGANLERDLHRNLAVLFGRARPSITPGATPVPPS